MIVVKNFFNSLILIFLQIENICCGSNKMNQLQIHFFKTVSKTSISNLHWKKEQGKFEKKKLGIDIQFVKKN